MTHRSPELGDDERLAQRMNNPVSTRSPEAGYAARPRIARSALGPALLVLTALSTAAAAPPGNETRAIRQDTAIASAERAARVFVQHVDSGRWDAAWALMADMLRNAVSMADWRATLEQGRAPFQPIRSRERVQAAPTTDFAGNSAVQLVFRITSQTSVAGLETMVLSRTPQGWRVSAYGITHAGAPPMIPGSVTHRTRTHGANRPPGQAAAPKSQSQSAFEVNHP